LTSTSFTSFTPTLLAADGLLVSTIGVIVVVVVVVVVVVIKSQMSIKNTKLFLSIKKSI